MLNKVFKKYRQTVLTLGIVLMIAGIGTGIWFTIGSKPKADTGKQDMLSIVEAVSKLMLLPTDEEPTLASVTDKSKLNKQTFLAKADNGDKILIYAKAQKIIIYRPNLKKIVDVGPLILDKTGSVYLTSKFSIRNGSKNPDLTAKMVAFVLSRYPNATIVEKQNASRDDFPTTISIDLSGKNQPLDEQIADTLSIKTGKLPLGEGKPDADFLIIIGNDQK